MTEVIMRSRKDFISSTLLTVVIIGQITLTVIFYNRNGNDIGRNIGWVILWISALFGWLPIFTLKRLGRTGGKAYVHTTTLVDRGVYRIVRHPQYLAGMLVGAALPLIAQHWIVIPPGVAAIVLLYTGTFIEEKFTIEKLGEKYERYMQSVPRVNFILGLLRLLRKGRK